MEDLRYSAGTYQRIPLRGFDNPGNDPGYVLDTGQFGLAFDERPPGALCSYRGVFSVSCEEASGRQESCQREWLS